MTGTLWGVGVGPGDPELLTLKAARVIAAADVVAFPRADGRPGRARAIAAAAIRPGCAELPFDVPMREAREPARAAYDLAAAAIAGHLGAGRNVAVLCEGDPMFYGSFVYLMERLAPRFACAVVPGVTSVSAAAAAARRPLALRDAPFTVLPGTMDGDELARRLALPGGVAILKAGRRIAQVRRALAATGRDAGALHVGEASGAAERVLPLAEAPDTAPYFALILAGEAGA